MRLEDDVDSVLNLVKSVKCEGFESCTAKLYHICTV